MSASIRRFWGLIALVVIAVLIALLRPWVVVPLHMPDIQTAQTDMLEVAWQRLMQGVETDRPIAQLQTTLGVPVLVQGRGVLVDLDTSSMNGWVQVNVLPFDDTADDMPQVLLHIGPVVYGTALRDAAGLSYDDFDTLVTYARAASVLNDHAMQALDRDRLSAWTGQVITFTGVVTALPPVGMPIDVVPLTLALEGSP